MSFANITAHGMRGSLLLGSAAADNHHFPVHPVPS